MNIKLLPSNSCPSAICRDVPTERLYERIKGFHTPIQQCPFSIPEQLMMEAKTLMDAGIKSGNTEWTKQAAVMMYATRVGTEIAQQSLGTAPPGSPFSLPFDSF
jgi:hypothetical protein